MYYPNGFRARIKELEAENARLTEAVRLQVEYTTWQSVRLTEAREVIEPIANRVWPGVELRKQASSFLAKLDAENKP